MERAQIAKLGEDLRKDAAPDVKQAHKELQDAQKRADKPSDELAQVPRSRPWFFSWLSTPTAIEFG